jgi:hypothetical protein
LTAKPFRRCGVQQQRISACAQKGAGMRQKGRKQVCVGINGNRQRFPEGARNLSLQRCDEFRRFIAVQLQDSGLKGVGEVNQFVQRFAPRDKTGGTVMRANRERACWWERLRGEAGTSTTTPQKFAPA